MKYKLIGIAAILITALAVTGTVLMQDESDTKARYHQHISAPVKEACEKKHDKNELCTHLPLLVIETEEEIPGINTGKTDRFGETVYSKTKDGNTMAAGRLDVIDSETEYNHPDDKAELSSAVSIRVRGHSSRNFEKAPYLLKLTTEDGEEREESLLGMGAHDEWSLHGPYLDKSLIRNYLFYNLSGEIMDYAPACRFCELVLNGDYRGIYLLTETVTAGEERLPLVRNENNISLSGYLLRIDRPVEEDLGGVRDVDVYTERTYIQRLDVAVRYPGKNRLTTAMNKRIEKDFSAFEKALYSFDYNSDDYGYEKYIDTDSFADYYIINSISSNIDAGRFSTYIYKSPGEKYRLCVWDFNNCCNNFIDDATGPAFDGIRGSAYFTMLFKDRAFVERVINRYKELRQSILSDDYINEYIDETVEYLGPAIDRDSERWADYIAGDQLIDKENTGRNPHSQAEAVEMLRSNLMHRMHWMDENIDYLKQYCAASANKKYSKLPM